MLRLGNLLKQTALVATGVTVGAALWKSRSSATSTGRDTTGPLRQSIADLEARLADLETRETPPTAVIEHDSAQHARVETLSATVASLENTVVNLTSRYDGRLGQLETRVGNHEAKLKEVPTLSQVVTTMEELLSKTMGELDQRLTDQVRSIDVLKTT